MHEHEFRDQKTNGLGEDRVNGLLHFKFYLYLHFCIEIDIDLDGTCTMSFSFHKDIIPKKKARIRDIG